MAYKMIVARFAVVGDARETVKVLREKGFTATLDSADGDLPDPDRSVSALMVGFLPDLAHGIFAAEKYRQKDKESAFLFVTADEHDSIDEVTEVLNKYGGKIVEL